MQVLRDTFRNLENCLKNKVHRIRMFAKDKMFPIWVKKSKFFFGGDWMLGKKVMDFLNGFVDDL